MTSSLPKIEELTDVIIKVAAGECGFDDLLKWIIMRQLASLLLSSDVPMKQIQEWLGHSDFSTTANIYPHLEYSSKLTSADALAQSLGL